MLSQDEAEDVAQSDEDLAARAGEGDDDAFGQLFERYFSGIYDHAARTLGDREAAADVAQATFTKAWEVLHDHRPVRNVKPWLYAIARNKAIDELRTRKRLSPTGEMTDEVQPGYWNAMTSGEAADPQDAAIHKDAAELVWRSASALTPQDYSLLDMHVRRGLTSDELAKSLGLRKGAVYTRLSRLKNSMEESVVSAILMRQGRKKCSDLDALLVGLHATELTREVSRAIHTHVDDCDTCRESKRRYVTPVDILAGLAPVAATPAVKDLVKEGVAAEGAVPRTRLQRMKSSFRDHWVTLSLGRRALVAGTTGTVAAAGVALTVVLAGGGSGGGGSTVADLVLQDPEDVHSVTHQTGEGSTNEIVRMAWTAEVGAAEYSIAWDTDPVHLPDATGDLQGTADGTTSPPLGPGSWYFHLRTRVGDEWTSTVHVGPFVIVDETVDEHENLASEPDADRPRRRGATPDPQPGPTPTPGVTPSPNDDPSDPSEPNGPKKKPDEKDPDPNPRDDNESPREDTAAPGPPEIRSAPESPTNDRSLTWTFTGGRRNSFECSLRGGSNSIPFGPCASPKTFDLPSAVDGHYVFKVRQLDPAGNRSSAAVRDLVLDTTPPSPPKITSGPSEGTEDETPTWTFTGEPGGSFECSLKGVKDEGFKVCDSPHTSDLTEAPNGSYTFMVRQADEAGNVSETATSTFFLRRGQEDEGETRDDDPRLTRALSV